MAELNGDKLKKLLRGERTGTIALIVCALTFVFFIVCFPVAQAFQLEDLRLGVLISAPVVMVAGVSVAAYCYIKFNGAIDRAVGEYVREVFLENARLMHVERDSLSYFIDVSDESVEITVNGYKEKIVFDFSVFGKLGAMRKLAVCTAVENRLCAVFCRLAERGAKFKSVSYSESSGRKKSKKAVCIIKDGAPDNRVLKNYYKNR